MTLTLLPTKTSGDSLHSFPAVLGPVSASDVAPSTPIEGVYHCLVTEIDERLVVHDLGTRGGTFVNGVRVAKAALRPGDTLSFNGRDFVVSGRPTPKRYLNGVRS